jgi:hypothetical protein
MDYLLHAFPVQLFETYTDEDGNERSQPVFDSEGNPVMCQEALRQRQELIEQIAMLPPIPSALDQIIQHFGSENVAEVTGRSQRIVREVKDGGDRLIVQKRSDAANLAETHAFMNGEKNVLVFSGAGATGRSYHADLNAKNQRQRAQYLLESGWRADEAVQGLGRTHRSNQAQPPLFRPVTTNVKGEKRFIRKLKNAIFGVEDALNLAQTKQGKFLFNEQSGGVAVAIPTNSQVDENGGIVKRLNLIRPTGNQKVGGSYSRQCKGNL